MAGYSGSPLAKKLGLKAGLHAYLDGAPDGFVSLLGSAADDVKFVNRLSKPVDYVHLFASSKVELEKRLRKYNEIIHPDGMIWVSWPKKASKVPTDVTEDVIR